MACGSFSDHSAVCVAKYPLVMPIIHETIVMAIRTAITRHV